MKLLCPTCSTEYALDESSESSTTCPKCGLEFRIESDQLQPQERSDAQSATVTWGKDAPARGTVALVPRKLGRYEVERLLGSGGYARVYLANDTQLHRKVALKVPRGDRYTPEQLDRFSKEAQTVASLEHPGIVQMHDVGVC